MNSILKVLAVPLIPLTLALPFLLLIGAAAMVTGCDKEINRVYHEEQSFLRKTTQTCNAGPGYCCEYGYDTRTQSYKHTCGLHGSCDGEKPVTMRVTPVTITYESKKTRRSEESMLISVDGDCK